MYVQYKILVFRTLVLLHLHLETIKIIYITRVQSNVSLHRETYDIFSSMICSMIGRVSYGLGIIT